LLVVTWHTYNNAFPTSDGIAYMDTTYRKYLAFFENGFIAGLAELYLQRDWRPQIFPLFGVFFLLLFGNNPIIAFAFTSVIFYMILSGYLYLILRIRLTPFYSCVASLFISLVSGFFIYSALYFSEIAYLPFLVGTYYYLCKSNFFYEPNYSLLAGVFMGLILCIRPAESLIMVFAILPFIIVGYVRKNISVLEILRAINIVLFTVFLLFYITYLFPHDMPGVIFTYLFTIFTIYILIQFCLKDIFAASSFLLFVLYTSIIVFIFWVPAVDILVNWSIEASVGSVIDSLGAAKTNVTNFLLNTTNNWLSSFGILILLLPLLIFNFSLKRLLNLNTVTILISLVISYSIILYTYVFVATDGQVIRRTLGPSILLAIVFCHFVLDKDFKYKFISLLFIFFITVNSYFVHLNNSLANSNGRFSHIVSKIEIILSNNFYLDNLPYVLREKPIIPPLNIDRHTLLVNKIKENACNIDPQYCLVGKGIYMTGGLNGSVELYKSYDPFTLGFINSTYLKNPYYFGFVFIPRGVEIFEHLKKRHVDYVGIEINSLQTEKVLNSQTSVDGAFSALLIKKYKTKKLKKVKLVSEITLNGRKVIILKIL